jgi:hypothetical protein
MDHWQPAPYIGFGVVVRGTIHPRRGNCFILVRSVIGVAGVDGRRSDMVLRIVTAVRVAMTFAVRRWIDIEGEAWWQEYLGRPRYAYRSQFVKLSNLSLHDQTGTVDYHRSEAKYSVDERRMRYILIGGSAPVCAVCVSSGSLR